MNTHKNTSWIIWHVAVYVDNYTSKFVFKCVELMKTVFISAGASPVYIQDAYYT